ncbi:hypothetical protein CANINC_003942 [Pichia inconspicua]|uniref:alpha-1,2-Mannosidase n=1 Tax=Pichia inconspicua TaxID=52247 RepID=A0A4T0WXE1_9ASCO|nr:hypothetical protein CANINC_003942 [[Candida] inconspicua]
MLTKAFFISIGIYFLFNWLFDSSAGFYNSGSSKSNPSALWSSRKNLVKETFLESWNDYVKHGWGYDVYSPVKQKGKNIGSEPLGWIIVDSLDTLMLMDCKEELEDAKSWVDKELNYNINTDVNVFETTIRMLGGLLSAHYLSDDPEENIFLEKAVLLGNKLVTAFDTPSGIPAMELNLKKEKPGRSGFPALGASTAEIATLQLEFKYLSNLTGEAYFWDAAEKVMSYLHRNQYSEAGVSKKYDGLAPIYVSQTSGEFTKDLIRLGSRGDSYYEYLLKQYLQTNEDIYLDMYQDAFKGIKKHLMKESYPSKYVYFGELPGGMDGPVDDKMDHLVCFIGGLFALGATNGLTETEAKVQPWWDSFHAEQLDTAKELAKTCYHMYHDTPGTHLSPEIVILNTDKEYNQETKRGMVRSSRGDFYVKPNDKHNLQRPETVETLYYLYKITNDEIYREWGWEIFQNFVKYTKVTDPNGKNPRYTCLKDCTTDPPVLADNMESFWLAETLKYLYLLFDDDKGSTKSGLQNDEVDKWNLKNIVFNTEAHPLPKFDGSQFIKKWIKGVGPVGNSAPAKKKVENIAKEEVDSVNPDDVVDTQAKVTENEKKKDGINKMVSGRNSGLDVNVEEDSLKENRVVDKDSLDDNVEVANKMKAAGEKLVPKQDVAKPLDQQLKDAIDEAIDNDDREGKFEQLSADVDAELRQDS